MYFQRERTTVTCVFENLGLGRCDNRSTVDFGCICNEHMNSLLNMRVVKDKIVSKFTSKMIMKQVLTDSKDGLLLPFPFDIEPLNENGTTCVNSNLLNSLTNRFVSQLNLTTPEMNSIVKGAFQGLFSNGYVLYHPAIGDSLRNFQIFLRNGIAKDISQRWQNIKLTVLYKDAQNQVRSFLFPATKLPIFYQIVLYYVEVSTHRNVAAGANEPLITFQPNVILSLISHSFEKINDNETNPIYILKHEATWASPLILAGESHVTDKIEPFTKYVVNNLPGAVMPNFCKKTENVF